MPTEAGEILLTQGETLLADAQRLRQALDAMGQAPEGAVAIGMPPTIAPALAPLTIDACKQTYPNISLHVIEGFSVFLEQALLLGKIDLESVDAAKAAIDRYFLERNRHFKENPKRAGNKIWGDELVPSKFSESNNCKNPNLMSLAAVH